MNKRSKKGAALDREIKKAKKEVREERPPICEASGMRHTFGNPLDCSHDYPEKHFKWLAAEKWNITLLVRDLHVAWERNHLWKITCTERLLVTMWEKALEETDFVRQKSMMDHVRNKIVKCGDFEEGVKLSQKLFDNIVSKD